MREFKINDFLTLCLEDGKTIIYVKEKKFLQCIRLAIHIPNNSIDLYENIDSIDEAADIFEKDLLENIAVEENQEIYESFISPEEEFQGHCSNLQVWYENGYNNKLLKSNLAFPLLKKLSEVGDPLAKRIFKEEIFESFLIGASRTKLYLIQEEYERFLNNQEIYSLVEQIVQSNKIIDSYLVVLKISDLESLELVNFFLKIKEVDKKLYNNFLIKLLENCSNGHIIKVISYFDNDILLANIRENRFVGKYLRGLSKYNLIENWWEINYHKKLIEEIVKKNNKIFMEKTNEVIHDVSMQELKVLIKANLLRFAKLEQNLKTDLTQILNNNYQEILQGKTKDVTIIAEILTFLKMYHGKKSWKKMAMHYNSEKFIERLKKETLRIDDKELKDKIIELLTVIDKKPQYVEFENEKFIVYKNKLSINNRHIKSITDIKNLSRLKNLKELNLISNNIEKIQGLKNLKKLKTLRLGDSNIKEIENIGHLKHLSKLQISSNPMNKNTLIKLGVQKKIK
ncbi:hypothetical protein LCGC14_1720510 [marine sediment metagenome]|uniref:Leucine-rich repeat domain-containing protein n=1 Tax=marine sediment metagenome TaxID=412755 RepID=A0A0F9I0D0_9ZZZZ